MRNFGFELLREQALEYIDSELAWMRESAKGDSEIEKLFYYALSAMIRVGATEFRILSEPETDEKFQWLCENGADPFCWLLLRRQVKLESTRVDFIVSAFDCGSGRRGKDPMDVLPGADRKWRHLVIECDGHDFHERTKAQAARDRFRDRKVVLSGMDCFRFTGSELWRDPWACAEHVFDWARNVAWAGSA